MTIGILIVDDHPLVRDGLTTLISKHGDLKLCGEASGIAEARELTRTTHPDVAIVDLTLNDGNGISLIKELTDQYDDLKVLALSMHDEALFAERTLHAGAAGYVGKHEASRTIIYAIRTVLDGNVYLSERMTRRMPARSIGSKKQPDDRSPVENLSDRELEIFEMIGRGMTSRQIAKELNVSQRTVDTHRENIKSKLNLKNAVELTMHAVRWALGER
ncbi:MAG TPA: response regulator transcription factor [Pirellulales bacterium]|nr:response regulator transcription factor [Pirellulales bacterium]